MKSKSKSIQNNYIDLWQLSRQLWKDKFLILFISLIFTVIGYNYVKDYPKILKTEIMIRNAPSSAFSLYQKFDPHLNNIVQFNKDLKLELLSLDNMEKFFNQNSEIDVFKNYLKQKNISVKDYFRNKFGSVKGKDNLNTYFLIYSENLPGEIFLNDYIVFVKQQATENFKENIMNQILSDIKVLKQNLEIAKAIDLERPLPQTKGINPDEKFYNGSEVLSYYIKHLNELLNETRDFQLSYHPIMESASSSVIVSKSSKDFAISSFLYSLIIMFFITLIKTVRKTFSGFKI